MAFQAPSVVRAYPSSASARPIRQVVQTKAFLHLTGRKDFFTRLTPEDTVHYVTTLKAVGSAQVRPIGSELGGVPSCIYEFGQVETPIITLGNKRVWNAQSIAKAAVYGFSDVEAKELSQLTGFAEQCSHLMFTGYNGSTGILNSGFFTAGNVPADSNGNTTISAYVQNEMAQWLASTAMDIVTSNQDYVTEVCITTTKQIRDSWVAAINPLAGSQQNGAGIDSVINTVTRVLKGLNERFRVNVDVIFAANDDLAGAGSGGQDLIVFSASKMGKGYLDTMPEGEQGAKGGIKNTNAFAWDEDDSEYQFIEMMATPLIERTTPQMSNDVTLSTFNVSPGWAVRNGNGLQISATF